MDIVGQTLTKRGIKFDHTRWEERYDRESPPFEELRGKTLTEIVVIGEDQAVLFITKDEWFLMVHDQDCCESVILEDVCGDWDDLLDTPILSAHEASSDSSESEYEYETWTFYRLASMKGSVVLRWCGSSNGYYSEAVSFYKGNI